ncbi:hypothetical protein V7S43_005326 [Phytophthora oleae]|uniref:Uncharacterized protein n=1 Tax=Phytophthora oleae TaxID=2107226 RepID=A0ABD3FT65_9STRA
MADVLVSVKQSFDKRLLGVWCEFDWDVNVDTVSDEFILSKIDEILSSVNNNSVPDVTALFKENITIDILMQNGSLSTAISSMGCALMIADAIGSATFSRRHVVVRLSGSMILWRNFFARSRKFIEEQGWQEFFTGNEGSRLKCKLLMESLQSRSLRDEVTTTVKYQARSAKDSEKELFKLILAKALEQGRDFQRRKRSRSKDQSDR